MYRPTGLRSNAVRRITSYNVCYTKLLRLRLLVALVPRLIVDVDQGDEVSGHCVLLCKWGSEIQAIHIEELMADADKNGFTVALVDHDGKVVTDADALAAGQGGGRSA